MSTATQSQHWDYTINEWSSPSYYEYLDIIFKNNDIKTIYDIGANVGATTFIFLNYCKTKDIKIEKIICFEPDSENMLFLKNKLNNEIEKEQVICIQKGVYYGKKEAKVFGAGHCSEGRIHPNVGGYSIEECMKEVVEKRNNCGENIFCDQVDNKVFQLDTLETLVESLPIPDLIKIDVEGAEKNILINSELIKTAKYIILEWNQHISLHDFVNMYLPQFEIISNKCDFLLKNKNYKAI
jgi:FkbM family methyltransferase